LKKVIVISYFFPPSNFVGSERTDSWAKNLHKNGIYPIIVTRNWNNQQKDIVDRVEENSFKKEVFETHEVHRLPYHQSLRDKCGNYKSLRLIQKVLSLFELIFSNFFLYAIPYKNIYYHCKKLIETEKDISIVIASGRPFQSFFFGYLLKKRFPIIWIPDYRDEWNTHQNNDFSKRGIAKLIHRLESKSEKKWTSNADYFISVSDFWVESISKFIQREGIVIMNGYNTYKPLKNNTDNQKLHIAYAGTLYESQKIDLFIQSVNQLNKAPFYKDRMFVSFIGTEIQVNAHNHLKKLVEGNNENYTFHSRMPKDELNLILETADLLLLTGFDGVKGWYPIKLFEYFATDKPILLFPSDKDVIEKFIVQTNSGFVVNSVQEATSLFSKILNEKGRNEEVLLKRNPALKDFYSRKFQNNKLGEFLNSL
jgi:hypothetical protein